MRRAIERPQLLLLSESPSTSEPISALSSRRGLGSFPSRAARHGAGSFAPGHPFTGDFGIVVAGDSDFARRTSATDGFGLVALVAAQLFISHKAVRYHLHKVHAKHCSASHSRKGSTWLRRALIEAACGALRTEQAGRTALAGHYRRLVARRGRQKAIVAAERATVPSTNCADSATTSRSRPCRPQRDPCIFNLGSTGCEQSRAGCCLASSIEDHMLQ